MFSHVWNAKDYSPLAVSLNFLHGEWFLGSASYCIQVIRESFILTQWGIFTVGPKNP